MIWRIRRKIGSYIIRRISSAGRRTRKRAKAEIKRTIEARNHRVDYFHQLDDPYSHLAAQKIPALVARYQIDLFPHLVESPSADAAPEAEMLQNYAKLDAARIAPFYGLEFSPQWQQPDPAHQLQIARILAKNHCSYLADLSTDLWRGDFAKHSSLEQASEQEAKDLIAEGTRLRNQLKHYASAMFYYEGEWYWGIDRLHHLEQRLTMLGACRNEVLDGRAVVREPSHIAKNSMAMNKIASNKKMKLEYFPSLRSPYSYLSIGETLDLPKHYPVELVLRPVMPMVMRGLKVPVEKGFYIFFDAKREAETINIDFGRFLDPVGPPVLRGFSLFAFAEQHKKGGEYLQSFLRAAFAEAIDLYSKRGLRKVVERIGLDWQEAKQHLDNEDWQQGLEENRIAMFEAGCWGVPSYRLLARDQNEQDFTVWGNDRIWLLKEEIARRLETMP